VRRRGLFLWLALCAYALALYVTAPAWPDDWDGIGFIQSIRDFDLSRFHPHPPGYPVYVALLRCAHFFVHDAIRACLVISVLSGCLAIALVWDTTRRLEGRWAAWVVVCTVGALPMVWRVCSGIGSEAPALAFAAACAWGLARQPSWAGVLALGLGAGLGLGTRLSWAPLYLAALAVVPPAGRARTWSVALGACAAWAVPLLTMVGPSHLVSLYAEHLAGHVHRWGGTVATDPGASRLRWLLRDVLVDGVGAGTDVLGVTVGTLTVVALAAATNSWRAVHWRGALRVLIVVVPYLVWISFAQNLRDQPRHVLPFVVLLAAGLALRASRAPSAFGVVCALVLLMSVRTTKAALTRRALAPPGAQLVALARAQPAPGRVAVFGTTSIRFFELTELAPNAFAAETGGDVPLRLARLPVLPSRVWVTSEVERMGADPPWPLEHLATLCGPPRLDLPPPCVGVDEWKLPYLPSR
jgi:hypothetical protein